MPSFDSLQNATSISEATDAHPFCSGCFHHIMLTWILFSRMERRGTSKKLRSWMLVYDILGILGYIVAVVKLLAFDETGTMMS
ncbi:unnamed protein product [Caenorhabditis nigoni]